MAGWSLHRRVGSSGLALVALVLGTGQAVAHIDLRTPLPREQGLSLAPNANLKMGPCGQVENGRTERVTVAAPGDTLEVTWEETTNHASYYRVAFDRDGDDAFPVFAGPGIGAAGIDPSGPCPVDGQVILAYDMDDRAGGLHTLRVRLPDVECERCTLQVVQYMFDRMRPYYFQCADLALRRPATDAGAAADAGTARVAAEPSAAPGCWSQIVPDAGLLGTPVAPDEPEPSAPPAATSPAAAPSTPPAATPATPAPASARSDSGCSLHAGRPRRPHLEALPAVLAAAWLGRRRWARRTRHAAGPLGRAR